MPAASSPVTHSYLSAFCVELRSAVEAQLGARDKRIAALEDALQAERGKVRQLRSQLDAEDYRLMLLYRRVSKIDGKDDGVQRDGLL